VLFNAFAHNKFIMTKGISNVWYPLQTSLQCFINNHCGQVFAKADLL